MLRIGILILLTWASFSLKAETLRCPNGLHVEVVLEESASSFLFTGLVHVKGIAVVSNPTNKALIFSTSHLVASFGKQSPTRGYKETWASEAIDIAGTEIRPNKALKVKMYWPFHGVEGEPVVGQKVTCKNHLTSNSSRPQAGWDLRKLALAPAP